MTDSRRPRRSPCGRSRWLDELRCSRDIGEVKAGASCVGLVLALLASASSAFTAEATFPGQQGLIAYYREAAPCRLDSEGGTVCRKAIWSSRLDGSGERRLTTVWGGRPSWSPDGRLIAHVRGSGTAGTGELWLMKADGSGARKLLAATARRTGSVRDSSTRTAGAVLVPGRKFRRGCSRPLRPTKAVGRAAAARTRGSGQGRRATRPVDAAKRPGRLRRASIVRSFHPTAS